LLVTDLQRALRDLFEGRPHDAEDKPVFPGGADAAGKKWADAYATYAAAAQAGPTAPAPGSTAAGAIPLATALRGAFVSAAEAPAASALSALTNAMQAAFVSYWAGVPPIAFVGPSVAGKVTLAPPTLAALLLSAFAQGVPGPGAAPPSAADQAGAIAQALHTWTQTVVVTYAPPPGALSPLT